MASLITSMMFDPYNPKGLYVCNPRRAAPPSLFIHHMLLLRYLKVSPVAPPSSCSHLHHQSFTLALLVETAMSETSATCVLVDGFLFKAKNDKEGTSRATQHFILV